MMLIGQSSLQSFSFTGRTLLTGNILPVSCSLFVSKVKTKMLRQFGES